MEQEGQDEDIGSNPDRIESKTGNHLIFHFFFGKADKEQGNKQEDTRSPCNGTGCLHRCKVSKEKGFDYICEDGYNKQAPANLLACMRHENTFLLHDVRFNVSVTKVSKFFKMPNKLGKCGIKTRNGV